jgi:hypothetical protein
VLRLLLRLLARSSTDCTDCSLLSPHPRPFASLQKDNCKCNCTAAVLPASAQDPACERNSRHRHHSRLVGVITEHLYPRYWPASALVLWITPPRGMAELRVTTALHVSGAFLRRLAVTAAPRGNGDTIYSEASRGLRSIHRRAVVVQDDPSRGLRGCGSSTPRPVYTAAPTQAQDNTGTTGSVRSKEDCTSNTSSSSPQFCLG